jgi:hypothetical protein
MDGPTRLADVTVAAERLVSVVGLLVPYKPGWLWTLTCRWNGAKVHEALSKDDVNKTETKRIWRQYNNNKNNQFAHIRELLREEKVSDSFVIDSHA